MSYPIVRFIHHNELLEILQLYKHLNNDDPDTNLEDIRVLLENNKVVLIKRNRNGEVYYVFPGGGIEKGETPELTAKREAFEELGLKIKVNECFEKVEYNGTQYFYLADIVEGEIGTGKGEEFTDTNRNRGTYEPMFVEIDKLSMLDVIPKEIAEKIQSLLK